MSIFNIEFENTINGFKWNESIEAESEDDASDIATNMCVEMEAESDSVIMFEIRG